MNIVVENKVNVTENNNGINTTREEIQALGFIQGLLSRQIDPKRISIRDARSYCAILIDDNNRKTLCRLFLENSKKKIELPKIEKTIEIQDFLEIKKAKTALFEVLNIIENKIETVKEPLQLPEPQPQDVNRELELQAQHAHAEAVADFVEAEVNQEIIPPTLPAPYVVKAGQPPMSYLEEKNEPAWLENA